VVPNGLPRDRRSDGLARSFSDRVLIVVVREAAPLPGETGFVENTTGSVGWRAFLTRHAITSRDGGGWPPVGRSRWPPTGIELERPARTARTPHRKDGGRSRLARPVTAVGDVLVEE
jgi:hypothetical protein